MSVTKFCLFDLHLVFLQATLCSKKSCLQALVAQLASDSEELHQVVSSILRNLSWRADISSKKVLRDIGCVSALMTCALQATKVTRSDPPTGDTTVTGADLSVLMGRICISCR